MVLIVLLVAFTPISCAALSHVHDGVYSYSLHSKKCGQVHNLLRNKNTYTCWPFRGLNKVRLPAVLLVFS